MASEEHDVNKRSIELPINATANISYDSNDFENNELEDNEMDITENGTEKKVVGKSGKKYKNKKVSARDPNAPRQPMSGYLRFLNNRREKFRTENPGLSFSEVTRLMGAEWSQLPLTEKQMYLVEAEKDRERYSKELEDYQKSDAYKTFVRKQNKPSKKIQGIQNNKKIKSKANEKLDKSVKTDEYSDSFNIPIFTDKFLEHNKARESELRQLKRQNGELEEGNAVLSKHVEKLKEAVAKMEADVVRQRNNHESLTKHLHLLRSTLAHEFANVALPETDEKPTEESIDNYMRKLQGLVSKSNREDTSHHESLVFKARSIIQKLSFETAT